jgi:hypothetical protein
MFVAQADKAERVDSNGMSEVQEWKFSPNPDARRRAYRQDKNGAWRESERGESGRWKFLDKSQSIRLGERDKYYDFSF